MALHRPRSRGFFVRPIVRLTTGHDDMTTASPTFIRNPWRRVWRWVSSDAWLALTLGLLAALLVLSVLLPQMPAGDPVAYSRWLSETQQRFGSSWSLLNTLSLFQITG